MSAHTMQETMTPTTDRHSLPLGPRFRHDNEDRYPTSDGSASNRRVFH